MNDMFGFVVCEFKSGECPSILDPLTGAGEVFISGFNLDEIIVRFVLTDDDNLIIVYLPASFMG
jgi:hypothetical protein